MGKRFIVGERNVAEGSLAATLRDEAQAQGLSHLDAELLLAHATGRDRAHLRAFEEQSIPEEKASLFRSLVQRRAAGEPLAYIEGQKEFWSLMFTVTPAVLVPRPETELLVERCLDLAGDKLQKIADLGTGSGAIAIALAHERPDWTVVATDASPAALEVATQNAQRLGATNIAFRHGFWCEALRGERFNTILSNPPYIAPNDAALTALRCEPSQALVAQAGGYADLRTIIASAADHLQPGGYLLLEHGASQAAGVAAALVARGYARVVCRPDLAGLDRVTEASWPW
jgi:release factor glutamine methyltransferase